MTNLSKERLAELREIEVQSLEARLFDAKHGISKPGTEPETFSRVLSDIGRAMRYRVGGDPTAVAAKDILRRLEAEALKEARATISTERLQAVLADPPEFAALGWDEVRSLITELLASRSAGTEVTDAQVEAAWREFDRLSGYSKPERFRAAIAAAIRALKENSHGA